MVDDLVARRRRCRPLLDLDTNEMIALRHLSFLGFGPSKESQRTISDWALKTFGNTGTNLRVAIRANEEMAELLRELSVDDNSPKAVTEIADILIVLYRLADRMGYDLHDVIDAKMQVNRKREWKLDKTGCGKHVRDKS